MRNGQQAEQLRTTTARSSSTRKSCGASPITDEAGRLLDRARVRAAAEHFSRASLQRRRAAGRGTRGVPARLGAQSEEPGHSRQALESVRTQLRNKGADRTGREDRTGDADRANAQPGAQGQELPTDVKLPASLTFRDAPSRDVFTALARFANISVTFDPQFRDQPVTIDFRETTLENALQALSALDAQLLPRDGPALHHRRPRHGGQATGVRRRGRPHLPAQQRGPEGNSRPVRHSRARRHHAASGKPGAAGGIHEVVGLPPGKTTDVHQLLTEVGLDGRPNVTPAACPAAN